MWAFNLFVLNLIDKVLFVFIILKIRSNQTFQESKQVSLQSCHTQLVSTDWLALLDLISFHLRMPCQLSCLRETGRSEAITSWWGLTEKTNCDQFERKGLFKSQYFRSCPTWWLRLTMTVTARFLSRSGLEAASPPSPFSCCWGWNRSKSRILFS